MGAGIAVGMAWSLASPAYWFSPDTAWHTAKVAAVVVISGVSGCRSSPDSKSYFPHTTYQLIRLPAYQHSKRPLRPWPRSCNGHSHVQRPRASHRSCARSPQAVHELLERPKRWPCPQPCPWTTATMMTTTTVTTTSCKCPASAARLVPSGEHCPAGCCHGCGRGFGS